MAVLRPVSRSFGHRLRLRALHLDVLHRAAESAHAKDRPAAVVSHGVNARRHRVAPDAGGVSARQHLASQVAYITDRGIEKPLCQRTTIQVDRQARLAVQLLSESGVALLVTSGPTYRRVLAPPLSKGFVFGECWPHRTRAWARMAFPRSLPTLLPARSRSTWSARSEARTYDVDGRRVAAIIGDEVGPELIHDQRLEDRQLGPKLTRR